ncbi:MAG: DUF4149 domain-containing protein [Gammaproteobacteria bacterium]
MVVTAWAGSLWSVGFLAAPLLFTSLPNRELAGDAARRLFTGVEYLGLGCGLLLVILIRMTSGRWLADSAARLVCIMLVLTTVSLLVIDPWLDRLRLMGGGSSSAFAWAHGVASVAYLLLCALALWLVLSDNTGPSTAR